MKAFLLTALLLSIAARFTHAAENPYDVFGKTITPIVSVFLSETKTPTRALKAEMTLIEMTGLAPEHVGTRAVLALENPDKVLLRGPILGEQITLCRDEQEVWAHPGAKLEALINALGELPKRKKKYKFEDFSLPFPEKNLVFLPLLFQVRDGGSESVNGVSCRVLDVEVMAELAKAGAIEDWSARAWVGPDYKLAKLALSRPGWRIVVEINKLDYAAALPEATWKPDAVQAGDVLKMDPPRFKQAAEAVWKKMESK